MLTCHKTLSINTKYSGMFNWIKKDKGEAGDRNMIAEILSQMNNKGYDTKVSALEIHEHILAMSAEKRLALLVDFPNLAGQRLPKTKDRWGGAWQKIHNLTEFYADLMRRKNDFTPEQLLQIITSIRKHHRDEFHLWPIGWIVNQLGKSLKRHELIEATKEAWLETTRWEQFDQDTYWGADLKKARSKISQLVSDEGDIGEYPLGKTNLAKRIAKALSGMPSETQQKWNQFFHLAASAKGAKPSKKFLESLKPAIDTIGTKQFKELTAGWLEFAHCVEAFQIEGQEEHWDHGRPDSEIQNLLKGLVWSLARFHDARTLNGVSRLTEKCFERLPGVGPAAVSIGNAGIYTLTNSKGLDGVAHLSRLKLRIKQNNTQNLIQKSIEQQAERLGLSTTEVEDMAAPELGLTLGEREFEFDKYKLKIALNNVGQVTQTWLKPDATPQKSVPAFVRESAAHKNNLSKARNLVKEIKKAYSTQRDRVDRLFTENVSWSSKSFYKHYLNHGLMSVIARNLLWLVTIEDQEHIGLYLDEQWVNLDGKPISGTPEKFKLWHPIMSDTATILAWRSKLESLEIRQAFKQTYREVYILTDAEIATKTYSNRMAAHLIKQHQFNALSAIRGWKYSLLGAYDDGRDNEVATKALPAYELTAEFWIDELYDMTESFNDNGIWDYVATDQVRFKDDKGGDVDLVDVPSIILSEILRDTDLFVGVASIGNDPTWADRGGAPRTNEYWQSYSFGNLSETANTRKTVLEGLIPRLRIKDVAHIDGKFLIVQGKRHTYKIHIGSGNILISPEDKYLCIVPGRGKDKNVDNIYLPFEGDRGLSIVLSKAFLLADDDKITDSTILSQL